MKINSIIRDSEIEKIIDAAFGHKGGDIFIGDTDSTEEVVIQCIDVWCKRIDILLRKIEFLSHAHSKHYRYVFAQRGITFSEYRKLFDSHIKEEDYRFHPVMRFLKIQTDTQRRYYTSLYENTATDYCKLLKKHKLRILKKVFVKVAIYLPVEPFYKHAYISGMTGSGKSELTKLIFYHLQRQSQFNRECSLIVLDPHGDLSYDIKRFHLNTNHERVIYVDPAFKEDYMPVINPLELKDKSRRNIEVVTNQLINVIEETMPKSSDFTAQMATILAPCISVLLRKGDTTLDDLQRFMNPQKSEDLLQLGLKSPNHNERHFFEHLFQSKEYHISKRSIATRIQSLLNIGSFYDLVGGKSTIDIEQAMNEGKILIVNLSKSSLDERIVPVFGRFLVAMILGYAFKRGRIKNAQRQHTFLFIDECQNFVSSSVATILDEARKFGLHLILINQFVRQIEDKKLMDAIKTNTNIKALGKNHGEHFHFFSRTIGIPEEESATLKLHEFYIKAGDRQPIRFTNSAMFVDNTDYELTEEEEDALDEYLLKTYYKRITGESPETDEKPPLQFSPKFDL